MRTTTTTTTSPTTGIRPRPGGLRLIAALALGVPGCVGTGGPTWTGEVRPLLAERCTGCHSDGNSGPFALSTYDDAVAWLEPSIAAVANGDMPPWDAEPVRAYRGDPSLDPDELTLLARWRDAGTPYGDPDDDAPAVPAVIPGLDRVDVTLTMPEPYAPDPALADDYRCFALPWQGPSAWITGFEGVPGALDSVHHLVAFAAPPWLAAVTDAFDDDQDAPGYPCFGGPSLDGWQPADLSETYVASLVGAWAPGTAPTVQQGSGLWVDAGSVIVLQVHYHPVPGGGPDQTSLRFRTDADVARAAAAIPFFDPVWLFAPSTLDIEAGDPDAHAAFHAPMIQAPGLAMLAPDLDPSAPMWIDAVLPHMHRLGTRIQVVRERDGVPPEPIVVVEDYDFDWQRSYELVDPVEVLPTDTIATDCWYDNTAARRTAVGADPEPVDVHWGEGTDDEMCIALFRVSQPR